MSKISIVNPNLKYPEKESATAFVTEDGKPFLSAVIGITYPHSGYRIERGREENLTVLEYVLEGEGELIIDGEHLKVRTGDTYVLRAGRKCIYKADRSNPWKKLWINYDSAYLNALLDAMGVFGGVYSGVVTRHLFEELYAISEARDTAPRISLSIANLIHKIIYAIASREGIAHCEGARIQAELESSVYERVTVDELSKRLNMSKSNFIRVFKRYSGVTPYEYLIGLKISAAKLLLCNTSVTVKELADRLCISDEHYFSTLFLTRVGLRPTEYRRKYRMECE